MVYSSSGTVRVGRTVRTTGRFASGCSRGGGVIITLIALCLLAWFEFDFARTHFAVAEVRGSVTSCGGDNVTSLGSAAVERCATVSDIGAVHFTGPTKGTASDLDFNLNFPSTLAAHRKTEYCQWEEVSHESCTGEGDNQDCETTYTYHKGWVPYRVPSIFFDQPAAHHNPQRDPYPSYISPSTDATIGDVRIAPAVLAEPLGTPRPVRFSVEDPSRAAETYHRFLDGCWRALSAPFRFVSGLFFDRPTYRIMGADAVKAVSSSAAAATDGFVYVGHGGYFFSPHVEESRMTLLRAVGMGLEGSLLDFQIGDLLSSCTAGDIRVSFAVTDPSVASVVGRMNGGVLEPIPTAVGRPVGLVAPGEVSAQDMFAAHLHRARWPVIIVRIFTLLAVVVIGATNAGGFGVFLQSGGAFLAAGGWIALVASMWALARVPLFSAATIADRETIHAFLFAAVLGAIGAFKTISSRPTKLPHA